MPSQEEGVVPGDSRWRTTGIILIFLALIVRVVSYPFVTSDYSGFLYNWSAVLNTQGLHAFAGPFADYAPLYLYVLKLLTYIPLSSLYSIKTFSVLCDILLSFIVYRILRDIGQSSKAYAFFAAALIFATPTIVINGSLWGQSDSVYAVGVLASFYFLLRKQPLLATILFAIAVSVKVQAIFFLPVLIGYLLRERGKVFYVLLIPVVFFLTLVPALLSGGSFSYWGFIYFKQAAEYPSLTLNAPSVFAFVNSLSSTPTGGVLLSLGITVSAILSLLVIVLMLRKNLPRDAALAITVFCVIALPYFLPHMHERYFYLADVFSVLYALVRPRQWYIPVLIVTSSFLVYMPYLSNQSSFFSLLSTIDLRIPALMLLAALLLLAYRIYLYIYAFTRI